MDRPDGVTFDEQTGTWVAKHTIYSAGRTEDEARAALASAVRLTAEHWPPRKPKNDETEN